MVLQDDIRLGTWLLQDVRLQTALERVAALALAAIPSGCGCGVMVVDRGRVTGRVATDPVCDRLEGLQVALREGPAIEALEKALPADWRDPGVEPRGGRFAEEASEAGVRVCLATPMLAGERVIGVLTVYADATPLGPDDEEMAKALAAEAAVALANTAAFERLRTLVDQLNQALESRDIIGQAKGVLMAREGIDAEEAFARLRVLSQATNQKLRDLARQVAASAAKQEKSGPIAR